MNWLARLLARILRRQANAFAPPPTGARPPTEVRVAEVELAICGCGCGLCTLLFRGTDANGPVAFTFALMPAIAGRLGDALVGARVNSEVRAGRN